MNFHLLISSTVSHKCGHSLQGVWKDSGSFPHITYFIHELLIHHRVTDT